MKKIRIILKWLFDRVLEGRKFHFYTSCFSKFSCVKWLGLVCGCGTNVFTCAGIYKKCEMDCPTDDLLVAPLPPPLPSPTKDLDSPKKNLPNLQYSLSGYPGVNDFAKTFQRRVKKKMLENNKKSHIFNNNFSFCVQMFSL
jgi:hypothetical protein